MISEQIKPVSPPWFFLKRISSDDVRGSLIPRETVLDELTLNSETIAGSLKFEEKVELSGLTDAVVFMSVLAKAE